MSTVYVIGKNLVDSRLLVVELLGNLKLYVNLTVLGGQHPSSPVFKSELLVGDLIDWFNLIFEEC